jgi:hypothetical protein
MLKKLWQIIYKGLCKKEKCRHSYLESPFTFALNIFSHTGMHLKGLTKSRQRNKLKNSFKNAGHGAIEHS